MILLGSKLALMTYIKDQGKSQRKNLEWKEMETWTSPRLTQLWARPNMPRGPNKSWVGYFLGQRPKKSSQLMTDQTYSHAPWSGRIRSLNNPRVDLLRIRPTMPRSPNKSRVDYYFLYQRPTKSSRPMVDLIPSHPPTQRWHHWVQFNSF